MGVTHPLSTLPRRYIYKGMTVLKGVGTTTGAYRNSYLIHVSKLQRIIVDVILCEGRGLWGWSTRWIRQRRRFLGITVPFVEIQALLPHILASCLIDQLQHLRALFFHQCCGRRSENWSGVTIIRGSSANREEPILKMLMQKLELHSDFNIFRSKFIWYAYVAKMYIGYLVKMMNLSYFHFNMRMRRCSCKIRLIWRRTFRLLICLFLFSFFLFFFAVSYFLLKSLYFMIPA